VSQLKLCHNCARFVHLSHEQWLAEIDSDLVERLRFRGWPIDNEAADEIERLKEELDELREAAREISEYRPVPGDVRDNWVRRWPWLMEGE
jgi:hypothetical protein